MARVLVDQMCGTLARYLRFCGHDAAFAPDRGLEADEDLAAVASAEGRRLITRDRSLGAQCERVILLEALDIEGQLAEVAAAGISLELADEPTRCGRCNGRLERTRPGTVQPPYVPDDLDEPTFTCRSCRQVFWRGSHWDSVQATIEAATG